MSEICNRNCNQLEGDWNMLMPYEVKENQKRFSNSLAEYDIKSAYRKASLKTHPDKGGDKEMFNSITDAKNNLISCLRKIQTCNQNAPSIIPPSVPPSASSNTPSDRWRPRQSAQWPPSSASASSAPPSSSRTPPMPSSQWAANIPMKVDSETAYNEMRKRHMDPETIAKLEKLEKMEEMKKNRRRFGGNPVGLGVRRTNKRKSNKRKQNKTNKRKKRRTYKTRM